MYCQHSRRCDGKLKMKRIFLWLCIGVTLLGLSACGNLGGTDEKETETGSVLVAYFSCTGTTKAVAEKISEMLEADLHEIVPEEAYTAEDLNYGDDSSRTSREQNDESSRPQIRGRVENMEDYDVIFLGYPIWWGKAPHIMRTFVETYDLAGKEIVPFCTSGSSGIGNSAEELSELSAETVQWREGRRFDENTSEEELEEWIDGLNLRR